jgi:hypothetical protein
VPGRDGGGEKGADIEGEIEGVGQAGQFLI